MKSVYEEPVIEMILFETEDVMTVSGEPTGDNEVPFG